MADETVRYRQLKEVLQVTSDSPACDAVLGELDEYVAAQRHGRDPFPLFPHVATHLDGCLTCAAAYGRLYRLALADQNNTLPVLANPRQPDLSFLPAPAATPSLVDRLRTAVEKLDNGWRLHLSAGLLPFLQPQVMPAPLRASSAEERYAELLLTLKPDQSLLTNIPFKLLVYRDAESATDCLVELWVQPHGRAWPHLAGFTVILQLPDQAHQQTTNAWGVAAFEHIPVSQLNHLVITVTE
ncbi:MAG: hypothetical protein BroJett015_05250 [Chloroflexota bacterium]|nr:hypothetical protein [Ardenticatenaceae bacterium]GIK54862.1 MAG: hypothetical protein BroJett015_05250 [Chloroflexota bacterium]